jgi:hypothetical protein
VSNEFVDPYKARGEMVREALAAADWQNLRDAAEKILDLTPADPAPDTADEIEQSLYAAGLDGFWSCHASAVAILAYALGLETRR